MTQIRDVITELQRLPQDGKLVVASNYETWEDFDILPPFMGRGGVTLKIHESSKFEELEDEIDELETGCAHLEQQIIDAQSVLEDLKLAGPQSDNYMELLTNLEEALA